jgi:two-component system response regulator
MRNSTVQKPVSILLAEDNDDHADLMTETFQSANINNHIMRFSNGKEAINFLEKTTPEELPDLALLDIKMPLKNGFDVLSYIKTSEKLQHIPTIIVTTSANDFEIKQAYDMGACMFLTKPISLDELTKMIESLNF